MKKMGFLHDHTTNFGADQFFITIFSQFPLSLQSTQSGRGREYIYVGRCQDARGGIILLNPETNRVVWLSTIAMNLY